MYWNREVERAERRYEADLTYARRVGTMDAARRAVYSRRYVRWCRRYQALDAAFEGVPSLAANALRRFAMMRGVDPSDPAALREFIRDQGMAGLMTGRGLGRRSAEALIAWAAS